MKKLFFILGVFIATYTNGQNLQFSRVFLLQGSLTSLGTTPGDEFYGATSITVPEGKIWKSNSGVSSNYGYDASESLRWKLNGFASVCAADTWLPAGTSITLPKYSFYPESYNVSFTEYIIVP